MVVFPHGKINLGLHVISKRNDGFHNIETCFYPIPWTDILEVIKSESFSFSCSGIPIPGDSEENLCIKAYQLLQTDLNLSPVKIHLHKVIPTGAGLGGGSSDAAFMLRSLNSLFSLNLSTEQMNLYAAKLGSDCSFFVTDTPKLGRGRGEILLPLAVSLKDLYLVIVKPRIHVSTAEAYAGVKPRNLIFSLAEILESPITSWKEKLTNDFEESVFQIHPQINKIKNELYRQGALYASMSGSGAAVFGIFNTPVSLKNNFEGDYWGGLLY